jgi:glycosyltransferase involved in cell wall biosynthesis
MPVPDASGLRLLGFEPFDAGSHQAMRRSIERRSAHRWTWITRPGRAWKWRMRLAAAEMVEAAREQGLFDPPIDGLFVTSLMSAADLRALLPRGARGTPLILYMHENQAAFPAGRSTPRSAERDAHFALTNLTSVLAADAVIWNSAYNLDSFVEGIVRILGHQRGGRLGRVDERIRARSRVIWPPVEVPELAEGRAVPERGSTCRVAWPHRWEHDKGPEELLEVARLWTEPLSLRWTILGQRFGRVPEALRRFQSELAPHLDHMGFEPDRAAYLARLSRCDWVLSTARHEYFGMAVVEAVFAGCLPWLPRRLSYTEIVPAGAQGLSPADPPGDAPAVRRALLEHLAPARAENAVAALDRAILDVVGSVGG